MRDAELQVCEDALHAVEGLLTRGSQVFLHGPGHGGKDGLSRLPRIHHLPRVLGGRGELVIVEALDVREGLLHCNDQPRKRKSMDTQVSRGVHYSFAKISNGKHRVQSLVYE